MLQQGRSRSFSSVYIIFALLCSFTVVEGSILLLTSSSSMTSIPSMVALYTDGNILEHSNWTAPPIENEDAQLMMSSSELSTTVMVIAALVVITGAVKYVRRDPVIIDD
jgi:hypothetical protein